MWGEVLSQHQISSREDEARFVPLVDIITGVVGIKRINDFVAVWRHVRLSWITNVLHLRRPPDFATRAGWESFASGTFLLPGEHHGEQVLTARENFCEFLEFNGLLTLNRDVYSLNTAGVQGPVDEVISTKVIHETIQELADLNFFFDLFEIEYRRTGDSLRDIVDRMQGITRSDGFLLPGEIPRSSADELEGWYIAIRDFMVPWPGEKPPTFFSNDLFSLERGVVSFYCSSVFRILRRQPVPPRVQHRRFLV